MFPPSVTRRLRSDLGWLGQCTGPVRDLDVHLLEFGSAARDCEEGKGQLRPRALRGHLAASRTRAYRALCRTLASRRATGGYGRHSGSSSRASRPRGPGARTRWSPSWPCRRHASSRSTAVSWPRAGRLGDASPPEALARAAQVLQAPCGILLEFFRDIHPAKPRGAHHCPIEAPAGQPW